MGLPRFQTFSEPFDQLVKVKPFGRSATDLDGLQQVPISFWQGYYDGLCWLLQLFYLLWWRCAAVPTQA